MIIANGLPSTDGDRGVLAVCCAGLLRQDEGAYKHIKQQEQERIEEECHNWAVLDQLTAEGSGNSRGEVKLIAER